MLSFLDNVPRYQLLHDLIGASIYCLYSGIGITLGHRGFPHEPPASMKLEAICSHLVLEVSGPVLSHAGHLPAQLVLVMVLHALIYEGSADGN